ncbi:MAG: SurA N-terminal domain-containing protein [Woeseiaceae bacterium]
MLQAIRNNAQGVFVWIVVGLIVVSFALFGLGSYLSGASKVVAASVNGVEIDSRALTRAYQNYQERLRSMFGESFNPELLGGVKKLKIEVLQGLISEEVLNQMLTEEGYQASASQVFEQLQQYKAFQEAGVFSPKRYKEVLSLQGINGQAFENDLSRGIASQQLRTAISSSAFLTSQEQETISSLQNQKRDIGYFDVSNKVYRKAVKVTDENIQSYYEKNGQQFLTQEKIQLEFIELKMDDVAANQEVSAEMVKEQYQISPESYMSSDDAATKKKMESLRKQIKQGADFATLAKLNSHDKASAEQGGDLGYLTRGVEENFDKIVFSMKKGELSEVIKSKNGYQLIQLDDIREGDPEERKVRHILIKPEIKLKSLASVKKTIEQELKYKLAAKVFFDDADQMNNLSYETPDSLEPVADALGIKVQTSKLMTRRGVAGLLSNPKVLKAAFSNEVLKEGRNSEVLEISDSHLVVVRVKQHQTAEVKKLNIVKPQIERLLVQQEASKKVDTVSSDILNRLKNNESLESLKLAYPNVKWTKVGWVNRVADKKSKLSSVIRDKAFVLAKPESATIWDKVSISGGDQAVIGLFKVEKGIADKNNEKELSTMMGNADYETFIQHLKSQADISISNNAIDDEDK